MNALLETHTIQHLLARATTLDDPFCRQSKKLLPGIRIHLTIQCTSETILQKQIFTLQLATFAADRNNSCSLV